jgi:asparagine synthase (glutamine-hydrolysing)
VSAIAGIIVFDQAPLDPALLHRLTSAMARRGPDGVSHWVGGNVGLGHCMLRTAVESEGEVQPLVDDERGLVVVMDGRLDNREELYRRLKPGIQPSGLPDVAFVLEAYARWGENCPRYLLGDFAFAVWDSRRKRLFCARDHLGAALFSYVYNQRFFAFSSDSEALLHLPGVGREPNEYYIASLLVPAFDNISDRRSWQRDVSTLKAAETVCVETDGTKRMRSYWQFAPGDVRTYASDLECEEHFLEVFGEAVRCRMRGTGDIAAVMSGGLDSAGIVAMIRRLLPGFPARQFNTYSAIDDEPETSRESRSILSLAASLDIDPRFVLVPSFRGVVDFDDLREAAWAHAHPVENSILLPAMMCLAARRHGDRVLLHGASGDLTMQSSQRYVSIHLRQWRIRQAWGECSAASQNNIYVLGHSPFSILLRNAYTAFVPLHLKNLVRRVRRSGRESALASTLINPEFASRIALPQHLQTQSVSRRRLQDSNQRLAQIRHNPPFILSALSAFGRVASRYGVEVRDPYADPRVLEFFYRLPIEFKVRKGWTKYLIRATFAKELEPEVRWRRDKDHLGWKFTRRLMETSGCLVSYVMNEDLETIEEYVDVRAVRALYDSYIEHGDDLSRDAVFGLVTLILWINRVKSL